MGRNIDLTFEDYKAAKASGATLLRLGCSSMPLASYSITTGDITYNEANFQRLDERVNWCRQLGIRCIIDPHSVFGSNNIFTLTGQSVFWSDISYGAAWARMWEVVAERHKDSGDALFGYALINEPSPLSHRQSLGASQTIVDINRVYADIVRRVRRIDPDHNLIIMHYEDDYRDRVVRPPTYHLAPDDRSAEAQSRICYDVHFYWPIEYTHQGIDGRPAGIPWPNGHQNDNGQRQRMGWVRSWLNNPDGDPSSPDSIPASRFLVSEFGLTSGSGLAWGDNSFQPQFNGDGWMETIYSWIRTNGFHFCVHSWGGNLDFDISDPVALGSFVHNMLRGVPPSQLRIPNRGIEVGSR